MKCPSNLNCAECERVNEEIVCSKCPLKKDSPDSKGSCPALDIKCSKAQYLSPDNVC